MGYINNRFSRTSGPKYNVDTKELPYVSAGDFFGSNGTGVFPVRALYINTKSKYGDAPCIVTDGCIVNGPKHLLDVVKEMRADATTTDLINSGRVGFNVYFYESSTGKACYSINFSDIEEVHAEGPDGDILPFDC